MHGANHIHHDADAAGDDYRLRRFKPNDFSRVYSANPLHIPSLLANNIHPNPIHRTQGRCGR